MKINLKKVLIVVLIIIILIAILFFVFRNNEIDNNTNKIENILMNSLANEENTLVVNMTEEQEEQAWEWQHDTLQNHNINASAITSVHNTIDSYPINAEVIVKDGVIVDEYYKDGYDQNSVFTLQSTSKSVTSALIGIAIDKGYIPSVNEPISTYFPQILESGSEYKSQITIWNLLTHTTGLNASDTVNWNEWLASDNWVNYVLERPATSRPGTVFSYFTGNTHLLSAIIQQATGKTAYEFGEEYLFDPLDMDSVECSTDPQGI